MKRLPNSIFFGPLKDAIRGRRFADEDELKRSAREISDAST
jgi:hypothetical protein